MRGRGSKHAGQYPKGKDFAPGAAHTAMGALIVASAT